jgi:signal transduction histidine kinase
MPFERRRLNTILGSLRFRLTLWNAVVVALVVVVTLIAVREGLRFTLLYETDQMLAEDALELGLAVAQFYPDLDQIHEEMNRKALGHPYRQLFVQLLDPQDDLVWSSVRTPAGFQLQWPEDADMLPRTVGRYRVVPTRLPQPELQGHILLVGCSLEHIDRDVRRLSQLLLLLGLPLVIVAPAGGYWLAGRATRPLGQIISTAAALLPSQLEERLPVRGTGDELDRLSETINQLLDRIAAYVDRHREFMANAAHELRSPLAAVQSSVEVALSADRTSDEYRELLHDVVEQCSHLRILVNQLLLLAEVEGMPPAVGGQAVRLDLVAQKSLEMFAGVAEDQGVHIESRLAPAVVLCSSNQLWQVVNNLIDNAIKFTQQGGTVTVDVQVHPESGQAVLQVRDTGVGIPAEDLPHICERFFRGDKSRQRDAAPRGNGLGLSICKAIVEAHAGSLHIESIVGAGTTIRVQLPLSVPCLSPELPAAV